MAIRSGAFTLVLALALSFGACTWSNDDIEFLYALPSKEGLGARAPDETASTQQGLAVRTAGLSTSAPSAMFQKTVAAAQNFNAMLFAILDSLERVKQLPPTRRERDRRIWGPVEDSHRPDREVRLVVERNRQPDESFVYGWRIELRHTGNTDAEWIAAVEGSYAPTADIRKGTGSLRHDAALLRSTGLARADDDPNLLSVDVGYDTGSDPLFVAMHLAFTGGTLDSEFEEFADGPARLIFDVRADVVHGPLPVPETIRFTSSWTSGGAGRTHALALGDGDIPTPTDIGEECWDETFHTVYFREAYDLDGSGTVDGTAGSLSACAL